MLNQSNSIGLVSTDIFFQFLHRISEKLDEGESYSFFSSLSSSEFNISMAQSLWPFRIIRDFGRKIRIYLFKKVELTFFLLRISKVVFIDFGDILQLERVHIQVISQACIDVSLPDQKIKKIITDNGEFFSSFFSKKFSKKYLCKLVKFILKSAFSMICTFFKSKLRAAKNAFFLAYSASLLASP